MGKKRKGNKKRGGAGSTRPTTQRQGRIINNTNSQERRRDSYYCIDPNNDISPEEAHAVGLRHVTDDLLDAVLSKGVVEDERNLYERNNLRAYFIRLVQGMAREPLILFKIVVAVLIGLEKGPPYINQRLSAGFGGEAWPILQWVCQWKLLRFNSQNAYVAGDELVDMVLKAGANVNDTIANNTNAMFFAVKYADMMAIDSLLRAGSNLQQLDDHGRTCMYNALEHPRPMLIEKLLSKGSDIQETFPTREVDDDGRIFKSTDMSLSDRILGIIRQIPTQNIVSWIVLGRPSSANLGETLILLRQRGAKFTEASELVLNYIGDFFREDLVPKTETVARRETETIVKDIFMEVANYLVGNNMPERFHALSADEIEKEEIQDCSINEKCSICLSDTMKKPVTLYCGHSFCRDCILEYGQRDKCTREKTCPKCRGSIGLDITLKDSTLLPKRSGRKLGEGFDIDKLMGLQHDVKPTGCGPAFLEENQIISEAKFRGIYNEKYSSRLLQEKILRESFDAMMESEAPITCNIIGGKTIMVQKKMDLGTSESVVMGTNAFVSPHLGPRCIDILVNGVPILARISNLSLYSVFSASVVEELRLRKIKSLRSRKFVGINGAEIHNQTFTCLEPVVIRIGSIDVKLTNAVEIAPNAEGDGDVMFGVQLGADFLSSARWCPIDVEIKRDSHGEEKGFIRSTDFNGEAIHNLPTPSKNMLRFYSHDGKTAHAPLLPFGPFKGVTNYLVSCRENVKFVQCMWCSRVFPEGMLVCTTCYEAGKIATYCDKRCLSAGYKCHKRFHWEFKCVD